MSSSATKPVVRIENYRRHHVGSTGILTGNVYGHPRFGDGTFVYTSTIVAAGTHHIETVNTIYQLGAPATEPLIGTTYAEESDGSGI